MKKERKHSVILVIISVLFILFIAVFAAVWIKKIAPSKHVMTLSDYFKINSKDEAAIILQNEIYDKKAIIEDDIVYIDFETVQSKFNKRFYWDSSENLLIYTTPTEVIKVSGESKEYYINKSKQSEEYNITKLDGNKVYLALDFIEKYSDIKYERFKNPNRIVVQNQWGDFLYAKTSKKTQLRYKPDIKSDILVQLKAGDKVLFTDTSETNDNGFSKVMTQDGVIGYVKTKYIKNTFYETLTSEFQAPVYTSIKKDYKINMVWHQVMNQTANNNLLYRINETKGVNTISPTWFSVISEDGDISSLASEAYVTQAHNLGIEVWALVDDFNEKVKLHNVLSVTSKREKLENNLIAKAIQYNLDGLNIDFEYIKKDTAVHYLQFIRELSIKCRANGIVLSIDNYVPMAYSAYYDRAEQAAVADYVITMAYDEHHAGAEESGSVSSYTFVKNGIENSLKEVPKEKLIIGIPFFTRLWKEVQKDGEIKVTSAAYGMEEAADLLERNNADITWLDDVKQNYGEFKEDGATFKMWLEDERSLEEKLKLLKEFDVAGSAGWKLGLEKKSIWNVITKYIN